MNYINWFKKTKMCIAPLLCLLLLVILLKQINGYDRIVEIIDSMIPVFYGIVIAFLLQPVIDRLQKHMNRKMSVCIVYFGILCFSILIAFIFLPEMYQQISELFSMLPTWISVIELYLNKYGITIDLFSQMKEVLMNDGYFTIVDSLIHTFQILFRYALGYMTAFFISIDLDFWLKIGKKRFPKLAKLDKFYITMSNIVFQYLIGTCIDLLFITISTGIVLYWVDFPSAMLYAILLALLNLFPYIGATFGLFMIAVVGMLSYDEPPYIVFLFIWGIQQLEANLIQPLIFHRTMNVRAAFTFVSIFISEALFGIPGVILSPIFAAVAQIGVRSYMHVKTSDTIGVWEDIWYDFDEVMREVEKQET